MNINVNQRTTFNAKTKTALAKLVNITVFALIFTAMFWGMTVNLMNCAAGTRTSGETSVGNINAYTDETWASDVNQRTTLAANVGVMTLAAVSAAVEPVTEPEPEWISLGEYTLTAYCPCVKCCGIWSAEHPKRKGTDYVQMTASGTIPEASRTVGADTDVLPFGTVISIDGAEYAVEDTGSAAKGKKLLDIFMSDHDEAVEFGRQTAEVWVKVDY